MSAWDEVWTLDRALRFFGMGDRERGRVWLDRFLGSGLAVEPRIAGAWRACQPDDHAAWIAVQAALDSGELVPPRCIAGTLARARGLGWARMTERCPCRGCREGSA